MPSLKIPGRYKATVKECNVGVSQTGTPYVNLFLCTDEKELTDAYLYLSDKAFERSLKTLQEAFGFDGDFDTINRQLAGKRCSIVAEEEENPDGNMRVRVRWINPEAPKPADKAFLAKLSGRARSLLQGQPQATPAPAPSVAPAPDDDDIPF